jgi:hypothetical protein
MWSLLQATIPAGGGPAQLSTSQTLCRQIIIQNNAAHSVRVGDSSVSATKGIYLAAGPGGGTFNSGAVVVYNSDLRDFYLFGTAADVIDVFYNQ